MPIIESVSPEQPLSQGDLLQGISLYATHECWNADGGKAVALPQKICLVISRPCVASHKEAIVVVNVEKVANSIPSSVEDFDSALKFLKAVRDGNSAPDVFYLGELPGKLGRFGAKLDSIHTVNLPDGDCDRAKFICACRIGRLEEDFVSDLHVRIFRAFASQGFDDVKWLSTSDLRAVVKFGKLELSKVQSELCTQEINNEKQDYLGAASKSSSSDSVKKLTNKVTVIEQKLAPYVEELRLREVAMPPASTDTSGASTTTT